MKDPELRIHSSAVLECPLMQFPGSAEACEAALVWAAKLERPWHLEQVFRYNIDGGQMNLADYDFCLQNIASTDCSVLLENSGGQMWICSYHASTYCLGAGWLIFVEDNGLRQHDSLVFEAVSSHHLKVYVFRAAKHARDSTKKSLTATVEIISRTMEPVLRQHSAQSITLEHASLALKSTG